MPSEGIYCPHLRKKKPNDPRFWCGVLGCYARTCDRCYDGHLLEVHMFANNIMHWRDTPGVYPPYVEARALHGKEICYGPSREDWPSHARERITRGRDNTDIPRPTETDRTASGGANKNSEGASAQEATATQSEADITAVFSNIHDQALAKTARKVQEIFTKGGPIS